MNDPSPPRWKPSIRDALFLAVVAAVVITLTLTGGKHTTKSVPDDATHRQAKTRAACMACHGANGIKPQPASHTKNDQCFLCHFQPTTWKR
ncbi:MAG: hypothetical protein Q9M26_06900 [Mariprofundales bacterium]|nr:hypothetical protein [Mariprofundales bacterium]